MATQTAIETAKRNLPANLPQVIERDGYKLLRALDRTLSLPPPRPDWFM